MATVAGGGGGGSRPLKIDNGPVGSPLTGTSVSRTVGVPKAKAGTVSRVQSMARTPTPKPAGTVRRTQSMSRTPTTVSKASGTVKRPTTKAVQRPVPPGQSAGPRPPGAAQAQAAAGATARNNPGQLLGAPRVGARARKRPK